MKRKRIGIIAAVITLGVLAFTGISLLRLAAQVDVATAQRDALEERIANQEATNRALEQAIENRYDDETIAQIARERYGLIAPGERIFRSVHN